jgi:hypothetical protein
MTQDETLSPVEENKSVSATELARALIEALQQNTATRGKTRVVTSNDTIVIKAIAEYRAIVADLETLPLSR